MAHTPAILTLHQKLADSRRLIEIHMECTGKYPGRRVGYDALNRSAITLAVAAWEGFVEDSVTIAARQMSRLVEEPSSLPKKVTDAMIAHLHQKHNWASLSESTKRGVWALAGTGWRTVYVSYVADKVGTLNTPNYENVRKLYASTLGLSDFTADWGARRWTAEDYRTKLDALLTLRHEIAHGAHDGQTVGKLKAAAAVNLVHRVAGWTDLAVSRHFRSIIESKTG